MIRQFLRRVFLDNLLLKLLALILSLVLFVAVRGDKDAVAGVYAKIIYVLPADRVLVSSPVNEVRLGIRGPWTRVSRIDERDLGAIRIDLSGAKDGEFAFTDEMVQLPAGLRLASITPSSMQVRFEPKVVRNLPVLPILEGEPAAGFRVSRSVARPSEVRIVGARSVVEALPRARTRPVTISDARERVRTEVALEVAPTHAQWDGTGSVVVEVEVAQALAERTLRAQPLIITGMSRLEGRLEPTVADVVLRGPAEALSAVKPGMPSLLIDAQAEDARPPGVVHKRISVVGLPPGVAAEVVPEAVTLVTRRHGR